jgi:hypothetical protein
MRPFRPEGAHTPPDLGRLDSTRAACAGKADILAGNYFTQSVELLLGNGDGTFQAPRKT